MPTTDSAFPTASEPYPALGRTVKFAPGRVVTTPGAILALRENEEASLLDYVIRHVTGDWGDLDAHDRNVNEEALWRGQRLLSAYALPDGQKIWLITEADRATTTALLPEEY